MIRGIIAILLVIWLLGFVLHVAGSLIHLLLVSALVVLLFDFIGGRRALWVGWMVQNGAGNSC